MPFYSRKRKIEAGMEGGDTPSLYTILPEKKADRIGASMMGSTHTYDVPSAAPSGRRLVLISIKIFTSVPSEIFVTMFNSNFSHFFNEQKYN